MIFDKPINDRADKKIADEGTYEALLNHLQSPVASERCLAAKRLADFKEAVHHLLERLQIEQDLSVREHILLSLITIGSDEAIKGMIDCLKSGDTILKNQAIYTLKRMTDILSPYIEGLVKSSDPDNRIFAIDILRDIMHPNTVKWLVRVIENDDNVNVCATALDLLALVGDEASLPAIENVKLRFKDKPYIQFMANLASKTILTKTSKS